MCVLSIKVPIQKKSGNLLYAPRIYLQVLFKSFFSFFQMGYHAIVKEASLSNYLSLAGRRKTGCTTFVRIFVLCEIQTATFKI